MTLDEEFRAVSDVSAVQVVHETNTEYTNNPVVDSYMVVPDRTGTVVVLEDN